MSYDFTNGEFLGSFGTGFGYPFTLAAWVKLPGQGDPRGTGQIGDFQTFLVWGVDNASDNNQARLSMGNSADELFRAVTQDTTGGNTNCDYNFSDGAYDNVWVPIVSTFDNSEDESFIYVGSTSQKSDPAVTLRTIIGTPDELIIGRRAEGDNPWVGKIAEVVVANSVWSQAQIASYMSGGVASEIDSSAHYYSLKLDDDTPDDEGVGTGPTLSLTGTADWDSDHPTITPGGGGGEIINRVLTSSTVVTDPVPGYQLQQIRPANSNAELTDAAFVIYTIGKFIDESFVVGDSFVLKKNLRKAIIDAVSIQDAINIANSWFVRLTDAIQLSDGMNYVVFGTKRVTLSDSINSVDSYVKELFINQSQTFFRLRTDGFDLSDGIDSAVYANFGNQRTDSLSVDDAIFLRFFNSRPVSDQIEILSDLLGVSRRRYLFTSDAFYLTDSLVVERLRIRDRKLTDGFYFDAALFKDRQYIRKKQLFDGIEVIDDDWFETGSTLQPSVEIFIDVEEY